MTLLLYRVFNVPWCNFTICFKIHKFSAALFDENLYLLNNNLDPFKVIISCWFSPWLNYTFHLHNLLNWSCGSTPYILTPYTLFGFSQFSHQIINSIPKIIFCISGRRHQNSGITDQKRDRVILMLRHLRYALFGLS